MAIRRPNLLLALIVLVIIVIMYMTTRAESDDARGHHHQSHNQHQHQHHKQHHKHIKHAQHKGNLDHHELVTHKALIHELQGGHHDDVTEEPETSTPAMSTAGVTYSTIVTTPGEVPSTTPE